MGGFREGGDVIWWDVCPLCSCITRVSVSLQQDELKENGFSRACVCVHVHARVHTSTRREGICEQTGTVLWFRGHS